MARTICPTLLVIWAGGFEVSLLTEKARLIGKSNLEVDWYVPGNVVTFTSSPDGLCVRVQNRGYINVPCGQRSRCDDGDESEEGEDKSRKRGHHGGLGGIGGRGEGRWW